MGCTFSFFREVWSFLSSVPELLCTFFIFLRGVPLPLVFDPYQRNIPRIYFKQAIGLIWEDQFAGYRARQPQRGIGRTRLTLSAEDEVSDCMPGIRSYIEDMGKI